MDEHQARPATPNQPPSPAVAGPGSPAGAERVNILIVDDKPDKVLALEAVLEPLSQNIVRAYSGREGLRCLLAQDFAVILLDVNMPGMDGFETAALIRQRQSLEHIPIIFITAYGDEMHVSRGYSLGAVDYILTPVVPEVLRTKVSVFVDLAKMTVQTRRQARWLEQRAAQLNHLTSASLAIHDALSIEKLLQVVTDRARELVGANQAFVSALTDSGGGKPRCAASFSDRYAECRGRVTQPACTGLDRLVGGASRSVRLAEEELRTHPLLAAPAVAPPDSQEAPPLRGWLAASLLGRDGRHIGQIQVSDKHAGDFGPEDEAMLMQLAQMASIAIENAIFAEAREANRLKDEFLATLSHELRTPLNAILGWARLLRSEENLNDHFHHGLDVIERNVKSQTRLIEDLLDVSRITSGKARINVRPMAMGAVVTAAADAVRPAAEAKRITLSASVITRSDQIVGDPDRLQQVVGNLLTNALKFTPEGGRVDVRLERDGPRLRVTVADTGTGIRPEFLPYVFDRFRQADSTSTRAHGGLGIGLAIVRHFVELHGGHVTASSAGEGLGATFTLTLPVAAVHAGPEGERKPADAAAREDGPRRLDGVHALLVDDEPDARELVGRLLRQAGAEVVAAGSADDALREFERRAPDVLISDLAMPGRDGYGLIRAVRRLPPRRGGQVPAVALTAYAREEDRARTAEAGFQAHAAKPVEPAALIAMIAELLRRKAQGDGADQHDGMHAGERR